MANNDDNTPHDRANEKTHIDITDKESFIPSLRSDYILKPGTPFDDLLGDSGDLLTSGLQLLRATAEELEGKEESTPHCERLYGVIYLFEAALSTLYEGRNVALEAKTIRGAPDGFYVGLDLIIEQAKCGNSDAVIQIAETVRAEVSKQEALNNETQP